MFELIGPHRWPHAHGSLPFITHALMGCTAHDIHGIILMFISLKRWEQKTHTHTRGYECM